MVVAMKGNNTKERTSCHLAFICVVYFAAFFLFFQPPSPPPLYMLHSLEALEARAVLRRLCRKEEWIHE